MINVFNAAARLLDATLESQIALYNNLLSEETVETFAKAAESVASAFVASDISEVFAKADAFYDSLDARGEEAVRTVRRAFLRGLGDEANETNPDHPAHATKEGVDPMERAKKLVAKGEKLQEEMRQSKKDYYPLGTRLEGALNNLYSAQQAYLGAPSNTAVQAKLDRACATLSVAIHRVEMRMEVEGLSNTSQSA